MNNSIQDYRSIGVNNSTQVFDFEGCPILAKVNRFRIILFRADNVCRALKFENSQKAIDEYVDSEDVTKYKELVDGEVQKIKYINRAGLFYLIFNSSSPSAKKFKVWILRKVLPFIDVPFIADPLDALSEIFAEAHDAEEEETMYLYAAKNTITGNIKVGISQDPERRVKQLSVGNDADLVLVGKMKAPNKFKDEKLFHKNHSHLHIRGEWFHPSVLSSFEES